MIEVFALIWLSRFIRPSVFSAQVIKCHANCEHFTIRGAKEKKKTEKVCFWLYGQAYEIHPLFTPNRNFVNDI